MACSINPLCEDDSLVTIYFEEDALILPDEAVKALAHHVNRDIGVGCGFVNVYTRDYKIANKAAAWLHSQGYYIEEIAEAV